MARNSKEKDSTYNKAYYERLKADPERMAERARKSRAYGVRKNKLRRIVRWESILLEIAAGKRGMSYRQIAEDLAEEFNVVKVNKGKAEQWIDFSPSKEKSLSSSSSSATAHPARTQGGAK